ncbi:MAG: dihydropteroate synthase [Magnetococcales bacterium]|nr:dihydropteroate synthase [Magnetococcales bacterium]
MGIVNVTPDSFSDGGQHNTVDHAVAHALSLVDEGADILDIGGESSQPGSHPVSVEEELRRVIPVIEQLAPRVDVPISIDTTKAAVMSAALKAGANIINDISALRADPEAIAVVVEHNAAVILMHMQGDPSTMQAHPHYRHVVEEVYEFFENRIRFCHEHGVHLNRLVLDPGIGFGKTTLHNLELIRHTGAFRGLGVPILMGLSRKRIVGDLTGEQNPVNRDIGSHVLESIAALSGASIIRTHDVQGAKQALSTVHGWALMEQPIV